MTQDDTHTTRLKPVSNLKESNRQRIELFFKNHLYVVEADDMPFRIGRDSALCDMVVLSDVVSRLHCELQVRDSMIGLQDSSTNGTSVRIGRATSLYVHRDFCPLAGHGALQLGHDSVRDDGDVILFKVVSEPRVRAAR